MAPPPSSAAAAADGFTHDVFLSFRGTDTRFGFTGNLYKALCDKGFRTFIDDEELHKGEEITPSLLKAIEKSRIAIIVLSKNYASSSFCLDELSKILHCVEEKGQLVWPVFYDVDPSDVRKLTGDYGEAMALHEERFKDSMERLHKWRMALQQVSNLSGWHFKHGDGYEHEFIGKIVEEVSRNIKYAALHVADYAVGLESKVLDVNSLLDVGVDDRVHMVGIHGIGGIGKTTLALAVYNSIAHHFEGSCFLENVRENTNRHGLLHIQKILLSEVLGEKNIELTSVSQGSSIIQRRLQKKKVLLILDDVDKREQLEAIVGRPEWFGPGSRVIITTRDKHLLTCHGVERKHEVNELNEKEALELLRWKAFKTDKVSPSYINILNRAVTYASGLPLALEVIGSHLFNKSIEEWKSALDRYEKTPNKEIQKILEVSYGALDEEEKSIFLDMACSFKGYNLAKVEEILHAHYGDNKKHHIGVLVEKSLIKFSNSGNVTFHDLIEDMGKEIVRRESPNEPGKRSRLWFHKDIIQVLEENSGTSQTEIICLNIPVFGEVAECKGETFKKMENLRTLIVREGHFSKNFKYLPKSLRVLAWDRYASEGLPFDFHPKKLSIGKFDSSVFTPFMSTGLVKKKFENMKVLILDNSQLSQIPDVSGLPNLEFFSFKNSRSLIKIHNSVGMLGKLRILCAYGCICLRSFPPLELVSLEKLDLSSCSLDSFPPVVGSLGKLKILSVEGCWTLKNFPPLELASLEQLNLSYCTTLESFPPVVGSMNKLKILSVRGCDMLKNFPPLELASLEQLNLSYCRTLESFPPVVGSMNKLKILSVRGCDMLKNFPPLEFASLEKLDLSYCKTLESFPIVFGSLGKLKILSVKRCQMLKNFPPLELAFLERLNLSYCVSLESFPPVVGSLGKLKVLIVKGCDVLKSFPPLELASLEQLDLSSCRRLESFPLVVGSLGKLKFLSVQGCHMLKNFPPLEFVSLSHLDLSYCSSLESFPEILGKMKCITQLYLYATPIKKLPFSFLNLTCLQTLYLSSCGIVEIPSSIVLMQKLARLTIEKGEWLFPKQDRGEEKVSPMQTSKVEFLYLLNCNLSDESLEIGLTWFSNVKELDLSMSNFTVVPECINECHFLWMLKLNDCAGLREIRGIPPSLKYIAAFNCTSLSSSCRSMLLKQEVHEAGNTFFYVPSLLTGRIPEWFEHQSRGPSASFWFRNNFPDSILLCLICPNAAYLTINGKKIFYLPKWEDIFVWSGHTCILHVLMNNFDLNIALLENEWNHVKVMMIETKYALREQISIGIHVLKEKSSMEDIRFFDPYKNT